MLLAKKPGKGFHGCRSSPTNRSGPRAGHDHVSKGFETHAALAKELMHALGHPTVARLTGVPDLKTSPPSAYPIRMQRLITAPIDWRDIARARRLGSSRR
jgi:hypothetical protein